jgi:transposase
MENGQELSAVWRERLEAQQASGLSVATWCRQAGVSAWSVYAWRKRLSPAPAVAAAKLISVPVSGMAPRPIDGRAPVGNNLLERDIRPFTTGRKAWMFSDTVAGANASAIIYSIMLTCRACNIEPYSYLRHVLTEMPQRPTDADIADLLPFNFLPQTASTID